MLKIIKVTIKGNINLNQIHSIASDKKGSNHTSLDPTILGPRKFVLQMDNLSHRGLIIASDQMANGDNLGVLSIFIK